MKTFTLITLTTLCVASLSQAQTSTGTNPSRSPRAKKFQNKCKMATIACAVFAGKCHNSDKGPSSKICLGPRKSEGRRRGRGDG
ncbi:MAG: hypothetical protein BYD32DRAFT_460252 [Podila humilis]|nr:MAG: hypothetical protein BYD32DRAFT_460252 [Podila humilis]